MNFVKIAFYPDFCDKDMKKEIFLKFINNNYICSKNTEELENFLNLKFKLIKDNEEIEN